MQRQLEKKNRQGYGDSEGERERPNNEEENKKREMEEEEGGEEVCNGTEGLIYRLEGDDEELISNYRIILLYKEWWERCNNDNSRCTRCRVGGWMDYE